MSSRCKLCNRTILKAQPTTSYHIHGCMYTVHHACKDLSTMREKDAEKIWDFKKLKRKSKS